MLTCKIWAMTVYYKSVWQYFWQYFNLKDICFEMTEMHREVQKIISQSFYTVSFSVKKMTSSLMLFSPQSDLVLGLVHAVLMSSACRTCPFCSKWVLLVGIAEGKTHMCSWESYHSVIGGGVIIFCSLNHSKDGATFVRRKQNRSVYYNHI